MPGSQDQRELAARYLLGALSEDEQKDFEESYFVDDDKFAELLTVESELIERYVRGGLNPDEKKRFEAYFLRSAERRRCVEEGLLRSREVKGKIDE